MPNALLPGALALGVLLLGALAPAPPAQAKSSDRNQPMTLDSDNSDCSQLADANSRCVFTGGVVIVQGTLDIRAERAEILQRSGETEQVILTGKQASMKQEMDDGTTMNARADRIVYEPKKETLTLTGNYQVDSPRGSNSGQRMVYDMASGQMRSGGDGSRVRTVIQPRQPAATPDAPGSGG
ncbi:lipopolysaccharide transport periplasmic protein LptA [Pseudoxanthomonas broegbernensis]|uniref:lipopolysaccharide transport periplasmic protein LptA n=1 Tax=Pseudoxanthomonas broegbernensis TaxID=83619 RepID=UPI0017ACFF9B|nr:lipopolysaccharide transport periplasmic protein LptA [Pseudoxanthomonas broegbernensis]MBB6065278.1 lipopolysaccharide export system protein LptA [Pseudoxanthomonas broegbernensis]